MMPSHAYCLHFLTIRIELQLVILKNMTGKSDLTLYITVTYDIATIRSDNTKADEMKIVFNCSTMVDGKNKRLK